MALSGSWTQNFSGNSNYKLIVRWSATQDQVANKSTITLKTSFSSGSTWSIYASGFKLITNINGSSQTTTVNISSGGGKEILLNTRTYTVSHNSDGTKSITLSAVLDLSGVSISGKSLGKADIGTKNITLNTIPRCSTLTSSTTFTCTNDLGVTISKASSNFVHKVILKSGSTQLKAVSFSTTSTTLSFSQTEKETLLKLIGGASSKALLLQLETWTANYGNKMGTAEYTITMNKVPDSTLTIANSSYSIGDEVPITVKGYDSSFVHTITMTCGSFSVVIANRIGDNTISYDSARDSERIYAQIPTTTSIVAKFDVETYLGSTKVGNTKSANVTLTTSASHPTIPSDSISYEDTNMTIVEVTGNNQYIVQNMSNLVVHIANPAVGHNGANIISCAVECGGKRMSSNSNVVQSFNFGTVDVSMDTHIYYTVTDSRGLSTTINYPLHGLKYNLPTLEANAEREGGYESQTIISASTFYSTLSNDGSPRNYATFKYRYREIGQSSWSDKKDMNMSLVGSNARGQVVEELDNTKGYEIEVSVTDRLGGYKDVILTIEKGVPLLFMDTVKKSIGVGDFPEGDDTFDINMKCKFRKDVAFNNVTFDNITFREGMNIGNVHLGGGTQADYGFNIGGEWGFTTKTLTSSPLRQTLCINGTPIAFKGNAILWQGVKLMEAADTIDLPINIDDCVNGFLLIWGDYDYVEKETHEYNFIASYIHKNTLKTVSEGRGWCVVISNDMTTTYPSPHEVTKYLYIYKNKITGNDANSSTEVQKDIVLRAVVVY